MRLYRVLCFSIFYLALSVGYFTYLAVRMLATVEPDTLIWYFSEYSLDRLIVMLLLWITNSPMTTLGLVGMLIASFILGFLTEFGIQYLRRLVNW
jgi:hypothetical protein